MLRIFLETSSAGAWMVPGPILTFFIGRWLWRHSTITMPDGRKWTRGEKADWEKWQRKSNGR